MKPNSRVLTPSPVVTATLSLTPVPAEFTAISIPMFNRYLPTSILYYTKLNTTDDYRWGKECTVIRITRPADDHRYAVGNDNVECVRGGKAVGRVTG